MEIGSSPLDSPSCHLDMCLPEDDMQAARYLDVKDQVDSLRRFHCRRLVHRRPRRRRCTASRRHHC